jgi:hypothetical protein
VAAQYVASAEKNWASAEPDWGIWNIPEAEVGMLPDDLAGKDAIELGWRHGVRERVDGPARRTRRRRRQLRSAARDRAAPAA